MKKIRKRARKGLRRRRRKTHEKVDPITGQTTTIDRYGIIIKNAEQIEGIRKASQLTRQILDMVAERIEAGIDTLEIDRWVHQAMLDAGAKPATLGYGKAPGRVAFPASVCTSINEVVCHGIPDEKVVLKDGDIVNVDVTPILGGYFGDASRMFCIGDVTDTAQKLVDVALECLDRGIAEVKPGADFGAIGFAIQKHAHRNDFSVVQDFGGHGVGVHFHEEPHVTHFGPPRRGITMKPGMIFTIEPMINEGRKGTRILEDNWTAVTVDGKLSAQWEHTVLVTDDGAERLTA